MTHAHLRARQRKQKQCQKAKRTNFRWSSLAFSCDRPDPDNPGGLGLKDRAVFSVFRRSSEVPLYRIEKDPRLRNKQGMYSVISASGLILRRGHDLERVLLVIDRKLAVV
jgi:hypothetical protein